MEPLLHLSTWVMPLPIFAAITDGAGWPAQLFAWTSLLTVLVLVSIFTWRITQTLTGKRLPEGSSFLVSLGLELCWLGIPAGVLVYLGCPYWAQWF